MDMFDILKSGLGGLAGGGNSQAALLNAVGSLIGSQTGGLGALVKAFEQNGLGNVVSSWVGTGPNLPISPEQISKGLGADVVGRLANGAGLAPDSASTALATLLPMLVDKLTPNGSIPEGQALPGLDSLKGLLGL